MYLTIFFLNYHKSPFRLMQFIFKKKTETFSGVQWQHDLTLSLNIDVKLYKYMHLALLFSIHVWGTCIYVKYDVYIFSTHEMQL